MQKFEEPVQNLRGDTIALAPMLVFLAGTETAATIYFDAAGQNPIADPRTDRTGVFAFYAANGRYDVYVLVNGVRLGHKIDLLMYDPADGGGSLAALSESVQVLADAAETTGEALDAVQTKLLEQFTVTDYLPDAYVKDGSVDYTAYVQQAVDAMGANSLLVFPTGVNVGVTRIAIDGKSDWAIRVDGKITNLAAKPGAAATDTNTAARGLAATFYITNCSRFKIFGPGAIDPGYREAFCIGEKLPANTAAPCSDFSISIDIKGSGRNDNMHANRIRYCSRFTFRDMAMDSLTAKPVWVNAATRYYYDWAETLLLWDCTDFELKNIKARNNGMSGAYIGSNCERFNVDGFTAEHNAGSGIQLAWSSFGSFPRHFKISGLRASFNRADTIDINNTGPLLDVFGTVSGNMGLYNGWGTEDMAGTTPTNDGSGIGTFINIKKIMVAKNIDHECSRTGGYFSGVSDSSVTNNIITKAATGSAGDGLYFLRCTNIDADINNVTVLPTKNALSIYGDNASQGNIRINKNTLVGQVLYAGGTNTGSLTNNTIVCPSQITVPVDAIGNKITVTGSGQSGMYLGADRLKVERNEVTAPNFGIIAFGLYAPKLISNRATGGVGGIRVDSCAFGKVTGNLGSGVSSPGIHLLGTCDNMELSVNEGTATGNNSLRVESTCTNTHKWGNRSIVGPTSYAGTYGINF